MWARRLGRHVPLRIGGRVEEYVPDLVRRRINDGGTGHSENGAFRAWWRIMHLARPIKDGQAPERYRDNGGVVVDVAFKRRWAVEPRAVKDFPV